MQVEPMMKQMNSITIGGGASKALQCMFACQQEVNFIQTGQNTSGGRYSYFKLEDLIGPMKPVLKEHRCVLLFNTEDADVKAGFEKVQGSKDAVARDKLVTYAYCVVTARIQNVDDPTDWVCSRSFGYKVDQTADKALGADTVASRYAVMHLVLAGTDIDPDSDQHDVRSSGLLGNLMDATPGVSQPQSPRSNQPVSNLGTIMQQPAPATSGSTGLSAALDTLMNLK